MDKIGQILTRGVTNIIPSYDLLEKLLRSGKKLNIYHGIEPTAIHIHLGNAVPLRKLQAFVELGHHVTFLIGDFTALIGDTSDKEGERPVLTYEQIKENFKTYQKQAAKIVDFSKVKVEYNSTWLKELAFTDIVKLCQIFSLNDFIARELIKKRLDKGRSVRLDEVLYPVMQGYDSYHMDTDIQIGGADQTFNMQAGRTLQKILRDKESVVLVTGYLEGTDGRKMSKSWGNAIWLDDEPNDMFGKIMSVKDDLIINYHTLATNGISEEIEKEKNALQKGENPISVKKRLASKIVEELHSKNASENALSYFENTFQKGHPQFSLKIPLDGNLAQTITDFTHNKSISDAKRLITQGSVDVDGRAIFDPRYKPQIGQKIKIGKKIFGAVVKSK